MTLKEMRLRVQRDKGLTARQRGQLRKRQIERSKARRVALILAFQIALCREGVWL